MSDIANSPHPTQTEHDADYQAFERLIAERAAAARGPLFTTDADGLFDAYLAGIPGETVDHRPRGEAFDPLWKVDHSGLRQHYNCRQCRKFIERYGGLVSIDLAGGIHPFLFDGFRDDDWPAFFGQASMNIVQRVIGTVSGKGSAKVTGVFINSEATWGTPFNVAGAGSKHVGTRWTHLHGKPSEELRNTRLVATAEQVMAEKKQDFITLRKATADFPLEACVQAVRVLEADAVDRSEKTLGVAKWLLDLHKKMLVGNRNRQADNLIWLAVATAPPGWCHVRSTMIGTLLVDIIAGLDFNSIKRRWDAKMHPLQYQRPTAPPSDETITAADQIIEKLWAAGALARRYALFDEILKFEWRALHGWNYDYKSLEEKLARLQETASQPLPVGTDGRVFGGWLADEIRKTEKELADNRQAGAFDNLRQKRQIKAVELPPKPITWDKFRETVLPKAAKIEVLLTSNNQPFYGMVTAVNPDSPPVLQWDELTVESFANGGTETIKLPRNPVSWYFWHGGSTPQSWGLTPPASREFQFGQRQWWEKVDGICLKPCHWQRELPHQGPGVFLVLRGAKDSRDAGGGYFPEMLRSEYHGIRSVIEAHSRSSKLAGREEGDANGIALGEHNTLTIRVNGGDSYVLSL